MPAIVEDCALTIEPFRPQDQEQARDLILAGLVEHWGWLDTEKNPDLEDIAGFYADSVFLVARWGGRIIGTGALVPHEAGRAEIVRMSVDAAFRRRGIGRRILTALCREAGNRGIRSVTLETTAAWQEVIAFYLDYGFKITRYMDGDAYFSLALTPMRGAR